MTVQLLESMGDDLAIVNAARESYDKESSWLYACTNCGNTEWGNTYFVELCPGCGSGLYPLVGKVLNQADQGLINYLMKNRHGTPFEMVQFKFRVHVPIKVAREWQRHRIGSFNETSTRYHEMPAEFYVPDKKDVREQVGKPGHYVMQPMENDIMASAVRVRFQEAYELIYEEYQWLLNAGVAKELASFLLPMGLFTEFIWSVNLRSLFNFMSLRSHETALLEIRQESWAIEEIVKGLVPVAFAAWEANGRMAP